MRFFPTVFGLAWVISSHANAQAYVPELDVTKTEGWDAFKTCLTKTVSAVEQVIPSLEEGADYLVEVSCETEANALRSEMSRNIYELSGETEFKQEAFEEIGPLVDSVPYLLRKVARVSIFATRKQRLGL